MKLLQRAGWWFALFTAIACIGIVVLIVTAGATFLSGLYTGIAAFLGLVAIITQFVNWLFKDEKPEEPEDPWTAAEGPIHVAGNGALYVFEGDRCKTVIR